MENWESRIQEARDAIDASNAQDNATEALAELGPALVALTDVLEACAGNVLAKTPEGFDPGHAC
jgi:hypothetical protein